VHSEEPTVQHPTQWTVDEQLFVDREHERTVFTQRLEEHWTQVTSEGRHDPSDTAAARTNLLVYYGKGGQGKTALAKWILGKVSSSADAPHAGTRIDLKESVTEESILLSLRRAVAPHAKWSQLQTFDVGFGAYWNATKLGVTLEAHVRASSGGTGGLFAKIKAGARPVAEIAGDIVPVPGTTQAIDLIHALVRKRREKIRKEASRKASSGSEDALRALEDAEDPGNLPWLVLLLARDLHQLDLSLVVVLDGFESMRARGGSRLEASINRMIWLTPNVLWVIGCRHPLDWGDGSLRGGDALDRGYTYGGRERWPKLAERPGDASRPHQVEVGSLLDKHADQLLSERVRIKSADGTLTPLIPSPMRAIMVKQCRGWPEHLVLAAQWYVAAGVEHGIALTETDFPQGFPSLVARVFEGLDAPSQNVLCAMALLRTFDAELGAAVADEKVAVAKRLVDEPPVRKSAPGAFWPHQLGEDVRKCLLESGSRDAWTPTDFERAAMRALDALGERFERHGAPGDRTHTIEYLTKALRIAHEHALDLQDGRFEWIIRAAYAYTEYYVWEATLRPGVPRVSESVTTEAQALGQALIAIHERQDHDRDVTARTLQACLDAQVFDEGSALDHLIKYFLAECHRDRGRRSDAESLFYELLDGQMEVAAVEGIAYLDRRTGQFGSAYALIREYAKRADSDVFHRLLGDLAWNHARFEECAHEYTRSCELAARAGLRGHHAESAASRAFGFAFMGTEQARDYIDEARELLKYVRRNRWAELQTRNAALLVAAGAGHAVEFRTEYAAVRKDAAANGLSSPAAYAALALALDGAIRDDESRIAEARAAVQELREDSGEFGYLLEIIGFWAPGVAFDGGTGWIHGRADAEARWRAVVDARRN
jgi:hypothetical protein